MSKIRISKRKLKKIVKEESERLRYERYERPDPEVIEKWADWLDMPESEVERQLLMPQIGITIKDVMKNIIKGKSPIRQQEARIGVVKEEISDEDVKKLMSQPKAKELMAKTMDVLKSKDKEKIEDALASLEEEKTYVVEDASLDYENPLLNIDDADEQYAIRSIATFEEMADEIGLSVYTLRRDMDKIRRKVILDKLLENSKEWEAMHGRRPTKHDAQQIAKMPGPLQIIDRALYNALEVNYKRYIKELKEIDKEIEELNEELDMITDDVSEFSEQGKEESTKKVMGILEQIQICKKQWNNLRYEMEQELRTMSVNEYADMWKEQLDFVDLVSEISAIKEKPLTI